MEDKFKTRERLQERSAEKISERNELADGRKCPCCGAPVGEQFELCPACGRKLVDYCTFCGAPMSPEDIDCPECGMPSEGVACPSCRVVNFRSFCRQCGQPLSKAARRTVEKAKQDPIVQQTASLLVQIARLQSELETAPEEETGPEEPQGPTEGELRLRELMAKVGFTPAETPKPAGRKVGRSREEVLAEYRKAVEDANKLMEQMLPPAGSTPQEQRNYYTARKVAVMEVTEEKWYGVRVTKTMGWECNECHILHSNPSECYVREFGGKWIIGTEIKQVAAGTKGAIEFTNRTEKLVYKRV